MNNSQIYTINYNYNPDSYVWFVHDYSIFNGKVAQVDLEIFEISKNLLSNKIYYWINTNIYGEYKVNQIYVFGSQQEAENYLNNYIQSTPTLTPTISLTNTPLNTFTPTPSVTISNSPTQRITPSITPTHTLTPSVTITKSITPTPSVSNTISPSITVSNTSSRTPSPTVSNSPTITPSKSITPTPSISLTNSISVTNTPSISATPSTTPNIVTVTATASVTPSQTATVTPTASVTPSQTATVTPTNTATPSVTPSHTTTATVTPTASVTPSITPSPSNPAGLYYNQIMSLSPLAYYRLGETSGTVAADSSGNGYNGTYEGAVTLGDPSLVVNNGGNLAVGGNGPSTYISVGGPSTLYGLNRNFTITAWLEPNFSASGQVCGIWSSGTGGVGLRCIRNGNYLNFRLLSVYTAALYTWETSISNGTDNFIALTCDSSGVFTLYINGTAVGSTYTYTGTFTGTGVVVGADSSYPSAPDFGLVGVLDEVAVFNIALTPTQINSLYTDGSSSTVPNISRTPTPTVTSVIVSQTVAPSITPSPSGNYITGVRVPSSVLGSCSYDIRLRQTNCTARATGSATITGGIGPYSVVANYVSGTPATFSYSVSGTSISFDFARTEAGGTIGISVPYTGYYTLTVTDSNNHSVTSSQIEVITRHEALTT